MNNFRTLIDKIKNLRSNMKHNINFRHFYVTLSNMYIYIISFRFIYIYIYIFIYLFNLIIAASFSQEPPYYSHLLDINSINDLTVK